MTSSNSNLDNLRTLARQLGYSNGRLEALVGAFIGCNYPCKLEHLTPDMVLEVTARLEKRLQALCDSGLKNSSPERG